MRVSGSQSQEGVLTGWTDQSQRMWWPNFGVTPFSLFGFST